jgi:hypothetical protein
MISILRQGLIMQRIQAAGQRRYDPEGMLPILSASPLPFH